MQIITISGTILGDSEVKIDKSGRQYLRFVVQSRYTAQGKEKTALYCCYSFDPAHRKLKNGVSVFVSGDVDISLNLDSNGKARIFCLVLVRHLDIETSD